jgi:hypothetical protein
MGDVLRLPTVTDFPFMPAQNVNMGAVIGHLKNYLQVYNTPSWLMWQEFENDLTEHISGFQGLKREEGRRGSVILTLTAKGDLGSFRYSVELYREFFNR